MIRLVVRGAVEEIAREFASHLAEQLRAVLEGQAAQARVLGPAPAPFAKLRGKYRFQIQTQGPDGEPLRAAVRQATAGAKPPEGVQWIADVDPLDML
jgi:primosomal protein N' (replication factor Y)